MRPSSFTFFQTLLLRVAKILVASLKAENNLNLRGRAQGARIAPFSNKAAPHGVYKLPKASWHAAACATSWPGRRERRRRQFSLHSLARSLPWCRPAENVPTKPTDTRRTQPRLIQWSAQCARVGVWLFSPIVSVSGNSSREDLLINSPPSLSTKVSATQ